MGGTGYETRMNATRSEQGKKAKAKQKKKGGVEEEEGRRRRPAPFSCSGRPRARNGVRS